MENSRPDPRNVKLCGIYCYRNGVSLRTSARTWTILMIQTYVGLAFALVLAPLYLYAFWEGMDDIGRAVSIFIFSVILIFSFSHVFRPTVLLRYILNRKRIFFWTVDPAAGVLHTALDSLQRYILDEDTLTTIEAQATACLQRGIIQKLSEAFGNRAVQLRLTGGTAERFAVPLSSKWINIKGDIDDNHALISDFDFMLQLDQISSSYAVGKEDLTIDTYECQIGYARLAINNQSVQGVFGAKDGEKYLSAQALKRKVYQAVCDTDVSIYPGFVSYDGVLWAKFSKNHFVQLKSSGPAIKLEFGTGSFTMMRIMAYAFKAFNKFTNHFLADITFSIPCKEWPSISDWPSRQNRCWPSNEDVVRIVKLGFHLVPKSQECEQSDLSETTWRFSFSQAEVELSKLISEDARKCFLALKIILKDFLTFTCNKLTSYHLKTIFLNRLERTGLEFWSENASGNGPGDAFKSLLGDLKDALDTGKCYHFWIPQINLFRDIPRRKLRSLSKVLDKVIQNSAPYIQPPQTSCCKIVGVNSPVLIDNVEVDVAEYEEAVVITYTTTADVESQSTSALSRDESADGGVNCHPVDELPESSSTTNGGSITPQTSKSSYIFEGVSVKPVGTSEVAIDGSPNGDSIFDNHINENRDAQRYDGKLVKDPSVCQTDPSGFAENTNSYSEHYQQQENQQHDLLGVQPSTSACQICQNGGSTENTILQSKQQQHQCYYCALNDDCRRQQQQQQSLLDTTISDLRSVERNYDSFYKTTTVIDIGNCDDDNIKTSCRMDFHTTPLPKPLRDILF